MARGLAAWRFRLLALSLLALLLGHAAVGGTDLQEPVMGPLGFAFLAALAWTLGGQRSPWLWALLIVPVLLAVLGLGERWSAAAGSAFHAPLLLVATWVVFHRVVFTERADEDAVVGSVCAYVLIAISFASVYAGIERTFPGAFSLGEVEEGRTFGRLLYFSFVTITTLGYGDVTPVLPEARGLVSLQSVIGILYPAVVVARLVGLATAGPGRPFALPPTAAGRFGGRYRLLALLLAGALVLGPWVESPAGRLGLGALLVAQLVGALYATGTRGVVGWLAWGLGGTALAGSLWPTTASHPIVSIGLMAEVGFFLLATGALAVWLVRERDVTTEVLFAGLAAYLMLGFSLAAGFELLGALQPGSVSFPHGAPPGRTQYVYFAFMTLTTTGFGEMHPASPGAENLSALGALVGIFHPAVLLARLVSLYRLPEEAG